MRLRFRVAVGVSPRRGAPFADVPLTAAERERVLGSIAWDVDSGFFRFIISPSLSDCPLPSSPFLRINARSSAKTKEDATRPDAKQSAKYLLAIE